MYWCAPYWFYPVPMAVPEQNGPAPVSQKVEERPQPTQIKEESEEMEKKEFLIFSRLLKVELERKEQNNFRKNWSPEEEKLLLQMRELGHSWENISNRIPDSTPVKCMRRYQRIARTQRKWPKEVDEHIIQKREEEGLDWPDVRQGIEEYTSKEIRMRYINYLRPGIEKDKWEFEEDLKLIDIVSKHSRKWKTIAEFFPARSELQVKNRFSRTLEPSIRRVKKKMSKIQKSPNLQRK